MVQNALGTLFASCVCEFREGSREEVSRVVAKHLRREFAELYLEWKDRAL